MKLDTILNIYQSYSLTKISALNKQNLIALYAQNKQLCKLNKELAKSNSVTEQILKNQIKEIEKQELCRYYKNLAFNLSQAITLLENDTNASFRVFASNMFLPIIQAMAKEATQALVEIADKEYANAIAQKCISLSENNNSLHTDYQDSSWAKMIPSREKIDKLTTVEIPKKEKVLQDCIEGREKKLKEIKATSNFYKGCFFTVVGATAFNVLLVVLTAVTKYFEATRGAIILLVVCLFILGITYQWKEKNKVEINDATNEALHWEENELRNELSDLKKQEYKLNAEYNEILEEVTLDYPKWETKLAEIANYLPKGK